MKWIVLQVVVPLLLIFPLSCQTAGADHSLPTGEVIEDVHCSDDASQSYAVYLPSNYTAGHAWPMIYAFDPLARGKLPVNLFKDAAEKYGYIVVGSNNSQNFSLDDSLKSANAIWNDTHRRFAIDERQTYTAGFSGGARVAGLIAVNCPQCKIAGVIAQGAGYWEPGHPPSGPLLYFLTVGDEDFNWPEVIGVRRERESAGTPYRVRVFAGPHQWAPKPLLLEAIEWLQLKAMQAGIRKSDPVFIQDLFTRAVAEAGNAEKQNDALAELNAYRFLVSDFSGLKDAAEYEHKLTSLRSAPALKDALKKEQELIDEQHALTRETSMKLGRFSDSSFDERMLLRREIVDNFRQLQTQVERADKDNRRNVFTRSFNDLWAQGIEAGQGQMKQRHFDVAVSYFQMIGEVSPKEPWPALLSAEAWTAAGNKKEALKSLREAVRRGLKNTDALERNRNLAALAAEPEFQAILAEMKKN